jgi:hypothetical protein
MLAGIPVSADSIAELATMVRAAGTDDLADRLDQRVPRTRRFSRSRSPNRPAVARIGN